MMFHPLGSVFCQVEGKPKIKDEDKVENKNKVEIGVQLIKPLIQLHLT